MDHEDKNEVGTAREFITKVGPVYSINMMNYFYRPNFCQYLLLTPPMRERREEANVKSSTKNNHTGASSLKKKEGVLDFLGSPVDKTGPANARDLGSIPSLGKFHLLQNN